MKVCSDEGNTLRLKQKPYTSQLQQRKNNTDVSVIFAFIIAMINAFVSTLL